MKMIITDEKEAYIIGQYNKVMNCAIALINQDVPFENQIKRDAFNLFKMSVFKLLSIRKLYDGINFSCLGTKFDDFKEPFAIWNIIRPIFESFCFFDNTFVNNSGERQQIIYWLWKKSGFSFRGKYNSMSQEGLLKLKEEQSEISKIDILIKKTETFGILPIKTQNNMIKDFKPAFFPVGFDRKGNCIKMSWSILFEMSGVKIEKFEEFYNYLSSNNHPSYTSTFQFEEMMELKDNKYIAIQALRLTYLLMSFYISDYLNVFEEEKEKLANFSNDFFVVVGYNNEYRNIVL